MTEPITLEQLQKASLDAQDLETFVSDPKPKDVHTRLGGTYPNLAKITQTILDKGLLSATAFNMLSELNASSLDDGAYAIVTNDPSDAKNGHYQKVGGAWQYLRYNPSRQIATAIDELYSQFYGSFVPKSYSHIAGTVFAVLDKDGNQTWLQANDEDGGMTSSSEQYVRDTLGVHQTLTSVGVLAVTDRDGNMTDIWLDDDGKINDVVLQDWHKRLQAFNAQNKKGNEHIKHLSHVLPPLSAQDLTINKHDTYYKDGELLPVLPDNDKIILLGSSSLDNSHDEILPELRKLNPDIEMYHPCFGGSVVNQMAAMLGSTPIKLRFDGNVINTNGVSNATISNGVNFNHARMTMTGWVQGVHGTLSAIKDGHSVIFTRTQGGQAVSLSSDVDFIPEKGNEHRNATQIIWIGKNNLTSGNKDVHDVDNLMLETDKMLSYNSSLVKRNIIITHFNNTNTPAQSVVRQRVNLVNHLYKLRYKSCVFDIEPIILGEQIFADLGIDRTPTDIEQQTLGNLPPSLSVDAGHFSKQTNLYIVSKLADFIKQKQWF